jgi:uncharacterized glyoxalase superfamily protein PhnB
MAAGIQPYICISAESGGAKKAIAWYKDVFDAQVRLALACGDDNNQIGHAELAFGPNVIMLSDLFPGMSKTPADIGGTPVNFTVMFPERSREGV